MTLAHPRGNVPPRVYECPRCGKHASASRNDVCPPCWRAIDDDHTAERVAAARVDWEANQAPDVERDEALHSAHRWQEIANKANAERDAAKASAARHTQEAIEWHRRVNDSNDAVVKARHETMRVEKDRDAAIADCDKLRTLAEEEHAKVERPKPVKKRRPS